MIDDDDEDDDDDYILFNVLLFKKIYNWLTPLPRSKILASVQSLLLTYDT